jgi:MoaA/NifB/PqqE/SkfB family radical SAM enzyme
VTLEGDGWAAWVSGELTRSGRGSAEPDCLAVCLTARSHQAAFFDPPTRHAPLAVSLPLGQSTMTPGAAMKPIVFGIKYVLRYHVFRERAPLICGLVLTNKCNLRCRHCRVATRGDKDLRFEEITEVIDSFRQEGGRCLYLQGGEPFLWEDGPYDVAHIVEYAHGVGFLTVIIYTNGTIPIQTSADTVFISIDGLQATHDHLRGASFNRIMDNIHQSTHPSLFINFTINSQNKSELEDFCSYVDGLEQIRGTFFYFHTPYYGYDELYVEPVERVGILRELLAYKKKYRILNSRAGLRSAMRNDWKRPLAICSVYEKGDHYECCRYPGNPELCRNCGYLSYAEIDQTLRLKPSAILNALKYF